MKKLNTLLTAAMVVVAFTFTQAQGVFQKGDNVINLTVGFGAPYYGTGYSPAIAFGASYEHCFFDDMINGDFSIGIGGFVGFSGNTYTAGGLVERKDRYFVVAGRGTFHWTGVENLDLYAGVHLGPKFSTSQENGTIPSGNTPGNVFYHSEFVGARWYFTDAFCATAEIGNGLAFVNVGVGFKF